MMRLDSYLTEKGLASSREKAKRLILDGKVSVNGTAVMKPSFQVSESDSVQAEHGDGYVGRGAYKLIGALDSFGIELGGRVCADIGASTGGFTQVMLEHGAARVYAVDVGHGQLDKSLVADARVVNCEGVNVRSIPEDYFGEKVSFAACDLSFISLKVVLPAVCAALSENAELVTLIKPQFEAGRQAVGKNGLVRSPKDHEQVLIQMCAFFAAEGLALLGLISSPIKGGDGNAEYLAHLTKAKADCIIPEIREIVRQALENRR